MFISKNWFYFVAVGYCLQIVGTVCTFFLPESPKFLFKQGLFERTSTVFQTMARVNRANPEDVSHTKIEQICQGGSDEGQYNLKVGIIDAQDGQSAEQRVVSTLGHLTVLKSAEVDHGDQRQGYIVSLTFRTRKELEEAQRVLQAHSSYQIYEQATVGNDKSILTNENSLVEERPGLNSGAVEEQKPLQPTLKYFLGQRTILINLIVMTLVWVTSAFNYYLLNFQVKFFPGNFNINMMMMSLADMAGYGGSGYLFKHVNVKCLFAGCFAMSGLAGLAILLTSDGGGDDVGIGFVFLIVAARLGISACFNLVFIGHPKMFPTLFSITSMGFTNVFSRTCTFFAPIIAEVSEPTPMAIFTGLCTVTTVAALLLRENSGSKT